MTEIILDLVKNKRCSVTDAQKCATAALANCWWKRAGYKT